MGPSNKKSSRNGLQGVQKYPHTPRLPPGGKPSLVQHIRKQSSYNSPCSHPPLYTPMSSTPPVPAAYQAFAQAVPSNLVMSPPLGGVQAPKAEPVLTTPKAEPVFTHWHRQGPAWWGQQPSTTMLQKPLPPPTHEDVLKKVVLILIDTPRGVYRGEGEEYRDVHGGRDIRIQ